MEASATLKKRLTDLKQRFVLTMPERIAAIASTLADGLNGGEVMDRLERQFHSLAGTAGTYDLDAVAAAALEGEEACAELKQSPLDKDNFTYLSFLVDQLHGAFAADAPAPWIERPVIAGLDVRTWTGVSTA
jgi:HPt (histidine-containing phosphotransfer) domain-containing protein